VMHLVPQRGARAMRFPGAPEILKMACGENPKRVYRDQKRAPTTRMGNLKAVRDAFLKAQKYTRDWEDWTRKQRNPPPGAGPCMIRHAAWQAEIDCHRSGFERGFGVGADRHSASRPLQGRILAQSGAVGRGESAAEVQNHLRPRRAGERRGLFLAQRPHQGLTHAPRDAEYRDSGHRDPTRPRP